MNSTNEVAKELIEEKNQIGFVIFAETQLAGKGQGKKVWESPYGGLWISLAIRPQIDLSMLGITPIISAVGIARTLEHFNINVMLKWPNDILIKHNLKKIGGILVETKVTRHFLNYLIIGIGLNINNTLDQYSIALQDHITTVYEEFNKEINLTTLLHEIIHQIEESFETLRSDGAQPLLKEWKQVDNILGMNLTIQTLEKVYQGKAIDISPYGQLILEVKDVGKVTISSGTVILPTK